MNNSFELKELNKVLITLPIEINNIINEYSSTRKTIETFGRLLILSNNASNTDKNNAKFIKSLDLRNIELKYESNSSDIYSRIRRTIQEYYPNLEFFGHPIYPCSVLPNNLIGYASAENHFADLPKKIHVEWSPKENIEGILQIDCREGKQQSELVYFTDPTLKAFFLKGINFIEHSIKESSLPTE